MGCIVQKVLFLVWHIAITRPLIGGGCKIEANHFDTHSQPPIDMTIGVCTGASLRCLHCVPFRFIQGKENLRNGSKLNEEFKSDWHSCIDAGSVAVDRRNQNKRNSVSRTSVKRSLPGRGQKKECQDIFLQMRSTSMVKERKVTRMLIALVMIFAIFSMQPRLKKEKVDNPATFILEKSFTQSSSKFLLELSQKLPNFLD